MFTPHSFPVALLMVITSTVCWGSWANTYKGVKNYRFELFYWDYAVAIFLTSLVLAFTMGSLPGGPAAFLSNLRLASRSGTISALVGGAVFNLANLLLVAGIDMAGLAIAFPVSIGMALVVGVVLSYEIEPRGHAALLGLGVLFALVAVILDGKAYQSAGSAHRALSRKGIAVCLISGILMGLWAPFVTRALTAAKPLTPYTASVIFTLGALVSCFVFNVYLMRRPLNGAPVSLGGFFRASARDHLLGIAGGIIWGVGTVFNLVAANFTGVAISYAIGQASPMVAALWGLVAWHEFQHANSRAKLYLGLMFVFYVLAIITVSHAQAPT